MEWPPQSPDLNIIEAIWDHLDRKKIEKQPKSQEELWVFRTHGITFQQMFRTNCKRAFPKEFRQFF